MKWRQKYLALFKTICFFIGYLSQKGNFSNLLYVSIHTIYITAGEAYDDIIYKNFNRLRINLNLKLQKPKDKSSALLSQYVKNWP